MQFWGKQVLLLLISMLTDLGILSHYFVEGKSAYSKFNKEILKSLKLKVTRRNFCHRLEVLCY